MTTNTKWIVAVSFLLAALGFLLPLIPLSLMGVLLAALSGRWMYAIGIGLLLDVAYGAPLGTLHYLYVPFTLLAVVASLAQYWGAQYFINKDIQDTL